MAARRALGVALAEEGNVVDSPAGGGRRRARWGAQVVDPSHWMRVARLRLLSLLEAEVPVRRLPLPPKRFGRPSYRWDRMKGEMVGLS